MNQYYAQLENKDTKPLKQWSALEESEQSGMNSTTDRIEEGLTWLKI